MSEYTPTTEVIRHALAFPRERLGEPRPIKPEAFDRWLAQVQADAWDEGHRTNWVREPSGCQCYAYSSSECGCGLYGTGRLITPNPYREES